MKTFVLIGLLAVCLFPDSASSQGLSYPCPMVGQDCYGDDIIRYAKISDERSCAVHIYAVLTGFATIGFGKLTMEIVI